MSTGEYWDEEEPRDEPVEGADLFGAQSARVSHGSLALGLVAMAPLFLAYEYGLAMEPFLSRSLSERVLFRFFGLFPDWELLLRQGTLATAVVIGLVLCFRRGVILVPSLVRIFLEGVLGAVLFGPVLALCMGMTGGFAGEVPVQSGEPSLATAGRLMGGAAFEELLFRVAFYGALFVILKRLVSFFGVGEKGSRWTAEFLCVVGSALAFAAFHLSKVAEFIGQGGGYAWDPGLFTWRALAGVLLALIFRWRGPAVAAWSHGLFNLAVLLGAGPEVFL
jgi:hypothetical protein